MDMDEQTVSSFEWAFLLRSEEDEFELMSSTEPIFKLKPRGLRGLSSEAGDLERLSPVFCHFRHPHTDWTWIANLPLVLSEKGLMIS